MTLTPRQISDLEQAGATIREHFVPLIHAYYQGCLAAGFTPDQALHLTTNYQQTLIAMTFRKPPTS